MVVLNLLAASMLSYFLLFDIVLWKVTIEQLSAHIATRF